MRLSDKEVESMLEYWLNTFNMGKVDVAERIEKELSSVGIAFRLVAEGVRWQRIEEQQIDEGYASECVRNYYVGGKD